MNSSITSILTGDVVDRIRRLEIFSRSLVEGGRAGDNRSPMKGFSTDFVQHRQYYPGDMLKYLDWRVLAKSDRLVIRQYEEHTNAEMAVVLDTSGSMGFEGPGMSKIEYAVRCTAVLLYLMFLQRDSFSLFLISGKNATMIPRGSGRRHLTRAFEKLVTIKAEGEADFTEAFRGIESRLSRRGLCVVISDFMDDPEKLGTAIGRIRMHGHDAIAFQVFDPAERELDFVDMTRFVDMEDGSVYALDPLMIRNQYQEEFDKHQRNVRSRCLAQGVDHAVLPVASPFDAPIGDYLQKRMGLLS